jgi:23S rRNA (pseudouridine1915-N3)-methyltransferase
MKLQLITIGKIKDQCFASKVLEYEQRIRHDAKIEIIELKDSNPVDEGKRLQEALRVRSGFSFVLSEEGKTYNSVSFAHKLSSINSTIQFVIGGPFGLDSSVKKEASELLSLSPMTFPHEIARLLLMEQIYRALTIIANSKYHK